MSDEVKQSSEAPNSNVTPIKPPQGPSNKPDDPKGTTSVSAGKVETPAKTGTSLSNEPSKEAKGPEAPLAQTKDGEKSNKPPLAGDHKAHQTTPLNKPSNLSDSILPAGAKTNDSIALEEEQALEDQEREEQASQRARVGQVLEDDSANNNLLEPEKERVAFQYDRDTTLVAEITQRYVDGTVDLVTITDTQGYFKTNISMPPQAREYSGVREGSKIEPGTFFALPTLQQHSIGDRVEMVTSHRTPMEREKIQSTKPSQAGGVNRGSQQTSK